MAFRTFDRVAWISLQHGMFFGERGTCLQWEIMVRMYVPKQAQFVMNISLTELRQRLFQLADRVVETGEPLIVVRNGVRLRLVRDDSRPAPVGRLARLKKQEAWIGAAPEPHFSPALWTGDVEQRPPLRGVAEPEPSRPAPIPAKRWRTKK